MFDAGGWRGSWAMASQMLRSAGVEPADEEGSVPEEPVEDRCGDFGGGSGLGGGSMGGARYTLELEPEYGVSSLMPGGVSGGGL